VSIGSPPCASGDHEHILPQKRRVDKWSQGV
jgi:hypothetical protein